MPESVKAYWQMLENIANIGCLTRDLNFMINAETMVTLKSIMNLNKELIGRAAFSKIKATLIKS